MQAQAGIPMGRGGDRPAAPAAVAISPHLVLPARPVQATAAAAHGTPGRAARCAAPAGERGRKARGEETSAPLPAVPVTHRAAARREGAAGEPRAVPGRSSPRQGVAP